MPRDSKIDFKDRAHFTKAEALAALARPDEAAAMLAATHPTPPKARPRLQIRISGPTLDALKLAATLAATTGAAVSLTKNHADKADRSGPLTGAALRAYLNL